MGIQAVFAEPHGFGLNDDDLALANFFSRPSIGSHALAVRYWICIERNTMTANSGFSCWARNEQAELSC
jgi:hypothetical protein